MTTYTINLEGNYVVTSRSNDVVVDLGALPESIVGELALHGLTQKIADAASGAAKMEGDVNVNTVALMQKAADALLRGEWSRRASGNGATEEVVVQRSIMRGVAKAKLGAKSAEWATFTGLDTATQNAKLDEWYAKNAAKLGDAVKDELARRANARKAKAKLSVDIAL